MSLYLVDISRTISRIGRGFATGIDRVETAYIKQFLQMNDRNLFIARLGRHSVVLDKRATVELLEKMTKTHDWGRPSLADAVRFKLNWEQRCARSFTKRRAISKALTSDVSKLLAKIDLTYYEYFNVGHTNLTDSFLSALKQRNCKKINVLIHDMIPLDYPEFSQSHIPRIFEHRMQAVAKYADRIICNSEETRKRVAHYFDKWGAKPDYLVSHLGIEPMVPSANVKPSVDRPYFVILGTIEPRKNHQLLFRVWERLAATLDESKQPYLYIIGRRGWGNIEAFQFLDESMLVGKCIFEKEDLNDKELANLLCGSNALLFPSFVEGFGLPALEAAQLGVPVFCSDLDTFKEVLGGSAVYLDPNSPAVWQAEITESLIASDSGQKTRILPENRAKIPTWESHFRHVFA